MNNTLITIIKQDTNTVIAKIWPLARESFKFDEDIIRKRYQGYDVRFNDASDQEIMEEIEEWRNKDIFEKKCVVFLGDEENPSYLAVFDDKYDALGFITDDSENTYVYSIHTGGETLSGIKEFNKPYPTILSTKKRK